MIDLMAAKRRCTPMGARLYFGGSSKSAQNTTNTDARVVGGEKSTNLSASGFNASRGSQITVSMLDGGAVGGALDLAKAGIEQANNHARETSAAQGDLLNGALKMAGEQQQAFTAAVENIKTSDVRTLVVAGLAVVGLAAVTLMRKG